MHPRVVNVRARGAEWDVYVGRGYDPARPGVLGRWGNPYTVAEHGPAAMVKYLDRLARLEEITGLDDLRAELAGQELGCWCAPRLCHADVLARLADGEDLAAIRADVLARVDGPRPQAGEHHCHARGCPVPVPPRMLMCAPHWRRVPKDLQAAVWKHYRAGQEITKDPTPAYLDAAGAAIAAVAEKEARGRARAAPSPQAEMFGARATLPEEGR